MKSRFLALVTIFVLVSLYSLPTHAIENGESALNDQRVVQTYIAMKPNSNILRPNCSGWLYAPRIVISAGHCYHDPSEKPRNVVNNPSDIYVGAPGSKKFYGQVTSQIQASKIYVYETFEWYRVAQGGTLSYKDDFAVVVLQKPLADVEVASLASKEFLDSLLSKKEFIEIAGYGFQDSARQMKLGDEPKKAKFQLISFDEGMITVNEFKRKWNRTYFQEDAVFAKLTKYGAAPCDGDSGSSFFYNQNGKFIHLGVMMGPFGSPNCSSEGWTDNPVVAFRPIYLDHEMVKAAERYVVENPYIEPKTEELYIEPKPKTVGVKTKIKITCVKGKTSKSVSGVNPKCPSGFKKK